MTRRFAVRILLVASFGAALPAQAQQDTASVSIYREGARRMVQFLEFTLNTLGDARTPAREKEIIIFESYRKIFRDERVQIEDDLVEHRSTATRKEVKAYLQDVDFFYESLTFAFEIDSISHEVTEKGELFFLVSTLCTLQGRTSAGDSLYATRPRYLEINVDEAARDLKIVSIYTTRQSEEEEAIEWWNSLGYAWREVFAPQLRLSDSVPVSRLMEISPDFAVGDTLPMEARFEIVMNDSAVWQTYTLLDSSIRWGDTLRVSGTDSVVAYSPRLIRDLRRVMASERLDLSGRTGLASLEPLARLTQLRELNLSGLDAADLTPLRYLTRLQRLTLDHARAVSLDPLRYCIGLRELSLAYMPVSDIQILSQFSSLSKLALDATGVQDLSPLRTLVSLRELTFNATGVADLSPLAGLRELEVLMCSRTRIADLGPLAGMAQLQLLGIEETAAASLAPLAGLARLRILYADGAAVASLEALHRLPELRRVYCDRSGVGREEAARLRTANPNCLVVYESTALQHWWQEMPAPWRAFFRSAARLSPIPTREELHSLAATAALDLGGHTELADLAPLSMITGLRSLSAARTGAASLAPLEPLTELEQLDLSRNPVTDLGPLRTLRKLRMLDLTGTPAADLEPLSACLRLEVLAADSTAVERLDALGRLPALRKLYADGARISDSAAVQLAASSPELLICYRTARLGAWLDTLPADWKARLRRIAAWGDTPGREALHELTFRQALDLGQDPGLVSLSPLTVFVRLRFLRCSEARVASLAPLGTLTALEVLECAGNPVEDLTPLAGLPRLSYLDVRNTPVRSLKPLEAAGRLEELYCSGTRIKKLRPLAAVQTLRRLDISNTGVGSLKPLAAGLEHLKCFNTKVSPGAVRKFREARPACEVVYY
ncbi:MAG: leucine-rich repeat domain-containing protein [Bacteroidia bacterium]|nr:leucine-rich repeat domain-containing protein [Bacteroidia bacterium]